MLQHELSKLDALIYILRCAGVDCFKLAELALVDASRLPPVALNCTSCTLSRRHGTRRHPEQRVQWPGTVLSLPALPARPGVDLAQQRCPVAHSRLPYPMPSG